MEMMVSLQRLSALAHEGRLNVFRRLVRASPDGLAAGELATDLNTQPNTLSAQLNVLTSAGLIAREREGRSIIYTADLRALNEMVLFLIEDCCAGRDEVCAPILRALQTTDC